MIGLATTTGAAMRHLIALLLLTTQAHATDPCEVHFRAGMDAFHRLDSRLTGIESSLYDGLSWVTRASVLEQLEARSPTTTACQEVAAIRARLDRASLELGEATRRFQLASAFCGGINRTRADGNLQRLGDSASYINDLDNYLRSLAEICDGS